MPVPTVDDPQVIVGHQEGRPAFEIHTNGSGEASGFTQFVDFEGGEEKTRIFPHTFVSEEFNGKGLASALVRRALDSSIKEGFTIVPVCPYVKSWIHKHPEYEEFSTSVTPEHLKALG
ncbi:GNAT family N-acetyltransferase [Rothia uropygialis]|uniref:GNAT family N-acetyltransferase n=1 Tax=Kocuria sp. 36 TaxID=1415402 RepID=UPI00101D170C|nr:GNAT family N-acetyltransferase [Kocuria sp. 36]